MLLGYVIQATLLGEDHHLHGHKCAVNRCLVLVYCHWQQLNGDGGFWQGAAFICWRGGTVFQRRIGNLNCTGTFTSHSPMLSWFLSCISQSSWTLSAQWCMVRITGLVSRAPGGPQLTTGLRSVWVSSTGGLENTGNELTSDWVFSPALMRKNK